MRLYNGINTTLFSGIYFICSFIRLCKIYLTVRNIVIVIDMLCSAGIYDVMDANREINDKMHLRTKGNASSLYVYTEIIIVTKHMNKST